MNKTNKKKLMLSLALIILVFIFVISITGFGFFNDLFNKLTGGVTYGSGSYGSGSGSGVVVPPRIPYRPSLSINCIDSDGGKVYTSKGMTTGISVISLNYSNTDSCIGNILTEYYCSENISVSENIDCSTSSIQIQQYNVCDDGACKYQSSTLISNQTLSPITAYKIELPFIGIIQIISAALIIVIIYLMYNLKNNTLNKFKRKYSKR